MKAARLCAAGFLSLSSCARADFPTTDPHAEMALRRPPGVAVDPVTEWPAPEARGGSNRRLLVLSAPRSLSEVHSVIGSFFRAMVAETPDEIDGLLTEQAFLESSTGRQPARGALRSRLAQLDYSVLRGVGLYREQDLEIYRSEDARALESARALPRELGRDQVFARIRMSVAHAGKARLFADQMGFSLRESPNGFRIFSITEDTPVP